MRGREARDSVLAPRVPASGQYERCCLCGRPTDVPVSEPVHLRRHYVQGVGQLCPDCCWEVYRTDDLRAVT